MLYSKEVAPVVWNIEYCTTPTVLRYCKKCGKKILQKNGAKIKISAYEIVGEDVSQFFLPLKISSVLRTKLGISKREFDAFLSSKQMQSNTEQDYTTNKSRI